MLFFYFMFNAASTAMLLLLLPPPRSMLSRYIHCHALALAATASASPLSLAATASCYYISPTTHYNFFIRLCHYHFRLIFHHPLSHRLTFLSWRCLSYVSIGHPYIWTQLSYGLNSHSTCSLHDCGCNSSKMGHTPQTMSSTCSNT